MLLSSYKTTSGAAFYDNGVQIGTSSSAFTMPPFSKGRLGQYTARNNYVPLAGYFNRLSYWPTQLSNTNLQELSSGPTMIPSISLVRIQFDKALNGAALDLSAYVTGGTPPTLTSTLALAV